MKSRVSGGENILIELYFPSDRIDLFHRLNAGAIHNIFHHKPDFITSYAFFLEMKIMQMHHQYRKHHLKMFFFDLLLLDLFKEILNRVHIKFKFAV